MASLQAETDRSNLFKNDLNIRYGIVAIHRFCLSYFQNSKCGSRIDTNLTVACDDIDMGR